MYKYIYTSYVWLKGIISKFSIIIWVLNGIRVIYHQNLRVFHIQINRERDVQQFVWGLFVDWRIWIFIEDSDKNFEELTIQVHHRWWIIHLFIVSETVYQGVAVQVHNHNWVSHPKGYCCPMILGKVFFGR